LTVLEAAGATDLTTLAKVKTDLGLTVSTHDALLGDLIKQVSDAMRYEARFTFEKQKYEELLPGHGSTTLMLKARPILSVASVTYKGEALTDFSIEDSWLGFLYRELGWTWTAQGFSRLGTLTPIPDSEKPDFKVTYYAGYSLPGDDKSGISTIQAIASDSSYNDSASGFPLLAPGDKITWAGFAQGGNNGKKTVVTATSSKITVSEAVTDEAAGGSVSWTVRTLPHDLEREVLENIKGWFHIRKGKGLGVSSRKMGDLSITYGNMMQESGLLPRTERFLRRFSPRV
jgi:hypothetical protein